MWLTQRLRETASVVSFDDVDQDGTPEVVVEERRRVIDPQYEWALVTASDVSTESPGVEDVFLRDGFTLYY